MTDVRLLDEVLLSHCKPQWLKVARVLGDAERDPRLAGVASEHRLDLLAARVPALFDAGQLDADGDLDEWRFSEIRLPSEAAE